MSNLQILLLIGAFLTLTIGSFVYYVATWDAAKEEPISFIWQNKLSQEARELSQGDIT